MALDPISFDSPETASIRSIYVHGTMPRFFDGYLTIAVHVTNTVAAEPERGEIFRREMNLANSSSVQATYHGTYNLAIVPMMHGSDTITATAVSWGLSFKAAK